MFWGARNLRGLCLSKVANNTVRNMQFPPAYSFSSSQPDSRPFVFVMHHFDDKSCRNTGYALEWREGVISRFKFKRRGWYKSGCCCSPSRCYFLRTVKGTSRAISGCWCIGLKRWYLILLPRCIASVFLSTFTIMSYNRDRSSYERLKRLTVWDSNPKQNRKKFVLAVFNDPDIIAWNQRYWAQDCWTLTFLKQLQAMEEQHGASIHAQIFDF